MEVAWRDAQFALVQCSVAMLVMLVLVSPSRSFMIVTMAGAFLTLAATVWTPSILGGVILPMIGTGLGVAQGYFIARMYDNYEETLTGGEDTNAAPTTNQIGTGLYSPPTEESPTTAALRTRFGSRRVLLLVAALVATLVHILPIAASDDHLLLFGFLALALVSLTVLFVVLLHRVTVPTIRWTWSLAGGIHGAQTLVVLLVIALAQSAGWAYLALVATAALAMIVANLLTAVHSKSAERIADILVDSLDEQTL